MSDNINGLINTITVGTSIKGDIQANGDFRMDGTLEGNITLIVPLTIEGQPQGLLRPGCYGTINIYGYTSGGLIFTLKPANE